MPPHQRLAAIAAVNVILGAGLVLAGVRQLHRMEGGHGSA
jgi:hypothetical protein